MSLRYSVYRAHDETSDVLRCCFQRKAKQDSSEAMELRRLLSEHFFVVLMRTPYSDIDVEKKGTFDMEAFTDAFRHVASLQELTMVFRLIDVDKSGTATYGEWQSFHKKHDPEFQFNVADRRSRRKVGSPEFLEYGSLLDGILLSCSRFPLMAMLQETNEPFPPSVPWLMAAMEAEWGNPKLRPHWVYATSPVPDTEEGRRFPDWNGGFTVRDEGHVGMTNEDFCRTAMATAAGLTLPEVVGLRLYTGPGYEALNLSLRANSQRFPVTQYCIDSAIGKMAHVAPKQPLLRGMRKPMDPRWVRLYDIYRGVGRKRLALSDPGFVSTTTDVEVATGKDFGGPVLFALHTMEPTPLPHCGFLSNGGDVQWVSQYPSEAEILLPSNVILVPRLRCRHAQQHDLPIPEEKRVYEFQVFYPWDFARQCPLVTEDFLTCANALLDHVHGLDAAAAQQCKAGHPSGVPTLRMPGTHPSHTPPFPMASPLDALPSDDPVCPGQADKLDGGSFQFWDPAIKSLCASLGLSPVNSSRDAWPADPAAYYAVTIDDQLHGPASLFLPPVRGLSAGPSGLPSPASPAEPLPASPRPSPRPLSSTSGLSLPHPEACGSSCGSSCGATPSNTDDSVTGSFYDPECASECSYLGSPLSTTTSIAHDLSGSDALRLAKVRHFTPADVAAALARLRNKPRYDDGLDDVGVIGNDFPIVVRRRPFDRSAWDVGIWGLMAGTVSAGLAALGVNGATATGLASALVTGLVVATAVPITAIRAPRAAVITLNATLTTTLSSSATVTFSGGMVASFTASRTTSPSPTRPRTRSPTPTRTATLSPSRTASPSPTRPRTRSPTPTRTATLSPTRTASLSPSRTRSKTPTLTLTLSRSRTASPSPTRSSSRSPTPTPTRTSTLSRSRTASPSPTPTRTWSRSPTQTQTKSLSASLTTTYSETATHSSTPTPQGSMVTFASLDVSGSLSTLALQLSAGHPYAAGDSVTVDVNVVVFDLMVGMMLLLSSNLNTFGCLASVVNSDHDFTLALTDDTPSVCFVPPGAVLTFSLLAVMTDPALILSFTATTSRDTIPYYGTASQV